MNRHAPSPEFDPRIADWLEADPDEAPGRILETVLAAVPSIPQRRASGVPWRTYFMSSPTRLGAAAALGVLLVGGVLLITRPGTSGVGGPSPQPSPPAPVSPSPVTAALDGRFTSDRYGYAIAYPEAWAVSPSSRSWPAGSPDSGATGINDELTGTGIRFSGAAQVLAPGQTADDWIRAAGSPVGALSGQGPDPAGWPAVMIDGLPGSIDIDGIVDSTTTAGPRGRIFDAVVVSGGYGFDFAMDGDVDRATFASFLATVKLPSLPVLDHSYVSPMAGYSIRHPASWSVAPATRPWTSGYDTESFSDRIGISPSIDATSMKLPSGMSFDAWFAAYDADRTANTCGAASRNEDITVGGAIGHLDVHCPTDYVEAVVSEGSRVYVFTMFEPFSRPLFESLLATVQLTPETART